MQSADEPGPEPSSPLREFDRGYILALAVLTVSTGIVDAVSYLSLDRVFTGNMTGNVLFIGFAIAGVGGVPLVNNLVALAAFLVGATVWGRLLRGRAHTSRLPTAHLIALAVAAGVMTLCGVGWVVSRGLDASGLLVVTASLAFVMAGQNIAARGAAITDMTTLVITNTLANFAIDSPLAGGRGSQLGRRTASVLGMLVGAAIGGLFVRFVPTAGLLASAFVMVIGVLLLQRARGRERAAILAVRASASDDRASTPGDGVSAPGDGASSTQPSDVE